MKKTIFTLSALLMLGAAGAASAQNWHDNGWNGHNENPDSHGWNDRDNRGPDRDRGGYETRRTVVTHRYVYYPRAHAYYAPDRHGWYYQHHGRWVFSERQPILSVNLGNGVQISLGADNPVTYDSYVVEHYGHR